MAAADSPAPDHGDRLGDIKTRRIPNYLTLGTAVAGLALNFMTQGPCRGGRGTGIWGMLLGFAFLIVPYLWGGMGAGTSQEATSHALGAWLGGQAHPISLSLHMRIAGGSHSSWGRWPWKVTCSEKIKWAGPSCE